MKSSKISVIFLLTLLSLTLLATSHNCKALTIHTDGFESGDFTAWDDIHFADGNYSAEPIIVSNLTHSGNYAAFSRNASLVYPGSPYCSVTWWGPSNEATINPFWARFYIRINDISEWEKHDWFIELILSNSNYTSGIGDIMTGCACVSHHTGDDYYWQVGGFNGSEFNTYPDSLWVASTPFFWDITKWYCVELGTYIHNSAGWYELYIDGSIVVNKTGLDNNEAGLINHVDFGQYDAYPTYWDDCQISGYYIGPLPTYPTGVYTDEVVLSGIIAVGTATFLSWFWRRKIKIRTVTVP